MTKLKRVILLLMEILMLVAGAVGVLIFVAIVVYTPSSSSIPTADVIRSTTGIHELRIMADDSSDKYRALILALLTLRWYFLGLGVFLVAGSVVHFCLIPWKLRNRHDHVA
jgi:hypothetical protein